MKQQKWDKGKWVRPDSAFRFTVSTAKGAKYPVVSGRYHLYICLACPWAQAALTTLLILGLENAVTVSSVQPEWDVVNKEGKKSWVFDKKCKSKSLPKLNFYDTVNNCKSMYDVYQKAHPGYEGRVTVPVLFDKKTNTIVNNESSEIIRMFHDQFRKLSPLGKGEVLDLYPKSVQKKMDEMEKWIYSDI